MFLEHLRSLNYLAIFCAGLVAFMLGGLWYTALFGKAWRQLSGYSDEQMKSMQAKRPMPVFFGLLTVCYIIAALALALLLRQLAVREAIPGAVTGLVVFIIVGAFAMTGHLSSPRPLKLYLIDVGFALVFLPVMGAMLGAWH
ncbi:MAG: DUF1761 domain-containing protein [Proteobacteria bacterium]|nr:DUF1761 domain-containing protein [Pseudomonadota bacterium]